MNTIIKRQSEKTSEQYAVIFLKEHLGEEIFLGSEIEQILAKNAFIIYQNVDDLSYFGAAIHLLDKHLIAINTAQPLRLRYYSAAHELWHLQYEIGEIQIGQFEKFNHERAADHFAANIMLPEDLVKTLLSKLEGTIENIIIEIADLSAMPYEAVTRRLKELEKNVPKPMLERTEEEWRQTRTKLGFPPSFLDESYAFSQFNSFSEEIEKQVKSNQITLEMAANLIKHIDPRQSEVYWNKRQQLISEWDSDDD